MIVVCFIVCFIERISEYLIIYVRMLVFNHNYN